MEGLLDSFREKGRLALLLLHHRPLRVCSVVAPSHPTFLAKTADLGIFRQALRISDLTFEISDFEEVSDEVLDKVFG
jgi:hypothetical protein